MNYTFKVRRFTGDPKL